MLCREGRGGAGLRRRGQGLPALLRAGLPRRRDRDRPDQRLQARWRATRSRCSRDHLETADIFITATGNKNVITLDHMRKMKDKAIVANIGHF